MDTQCVGRREGIAGGGGRGRPTWLILLPLQADSNCDWMLGVGHVTLERSCENDFFKPFDHVTFGIIPTVQHKGFFWFCPFDFCLGFFTVNSFAFLLPHFAASNGVEQLEQAQRKRWWNQMQDKLKSTWSSFQISFFPLICVCRLLYTTHYFPCCTYRLLSRLKPDLLQLVLGHFLCF